MHRSLALLASLTRLTTAFWQPAVETSWQIVLIQPLANTSLDVAVFDNDLFTLNQTEIQGIQASGRRVICYFSAGSYENWRPDAGEFVNATDIGNPLQGWEGEAWLNTNSANVRNIMMKRMDMAQQKGCDAIDPDNVDAYDNDNGLGLTQDDAVNYTTWLADQAHQRGMACGLKNGGKILERVLPSMQFSVNEQCVQYGECDTFQAFIQAGKPVFGIEYPHNFTQETVDDICNDPSRQGMSTLLKHMLLDQFYVACPGTMAFVANGAGSGSINSSSTASVAGSAPSTTGLASSPTATGESDESGAATSASGLVSTSSAVTSTATPSSSPKTSSASIIKGSGPATAVVTVIASVCLAALQ